MSRLVKSQWTFFELLTSDITNKQRRALLNNITNNQLTTLVQIVNNFLHKNITVSTSQLSKLERYKRLLRHIADTSISLKNKRSLLKRREKEINEFLRAVNRL